MYPFHSTLFIQEWTFPVWVSLRVTGSVRKPALAGFLSVGHSSCQESAPAWAFQGINASFKACPPAWCGVLHGLQVDLYSLLDLHGLQGGTASPWSSLCVMCPVSFGLGTPVLNTEMQLCFTRDEQREEDHLLWLCDYDLNTAQASVGLRCKGTLIDHVQPGVQQDPQILLCQATLEPSTPACAGA